MPRKNKPEKYLLAELVEISNGRPLPIHPDGLGPEYIHYNDPAKAIGSPGSNNYAIIALACKYIMKEPGCRDKVFEVCNKMKTHYGGKEMDSSIYEPLSAGSMWVIQEFAKRRGDSTVYEAVSELNRYRAARYTLFYDFEKREILSVGQRSAGFEDAGWMSFVASLGFGLIGNENKQLNKIKNASYKPMRLIVVAANEIKKSFSGLKGNKREAQDILKEKKYLSIIPVFYCEHKGGFSVWQQKNINGNTQPVLLGISKDGKFIYGPKNRGSKSKNRKKGAASVSFFSSLDSVTVRFKSVVYGEDFSIHLNDVVKLIEIGGQVGFKSWNLNSVVSVEPTDNEDQDGPAGDETQSKESRWERFKDWLSTIREKIRGVLN